MYLSKHSNHNLPLYISLFQDLSTGICIKEKSAIDKVLLEAKEIESGSKSIFSANNEYYHLLIFLISQAKKHIVDITPETIDQNTYSKIADLLESEF